MDLGRLLFLETLGVPALSCQKKSFLMPTSPTVAGVKWPTDYLGRIDNFPVLRCYVRCPYFEGWTDVVRTPIKFASVMIGDVPGVRVPKEPYTTFNYGDQPPASAPALKPDPVYPDSPATRVCESVTTASSTRPQVCVMETRISTARMKRPHPLHLPNLQP